MAARNLLIAWSLLIVERLLRAVRLSLRRAWALEGPRLSVRLRGLVRIIWLLHVRLGGLVPSIRLRCGGAVASLHELRGGRGG